MSAQAFVLLGVVVGALLAGVGNLLLAWRQETQEARAGAQVVLELLARSEAALSNRASTQTWWALGDVPTSDPWKPYRRALAVRLPRDVLAAIEAAFATLDTLNQTAAFQTARYAEFRTRVFDATLQKGVAANDEQRERAEGVVEELNAYGEKEGLLHIDDTKVGRLCQAVGQFETVRAQLAAVTPVRLPTKSERTKAAAIANKPLGLLNWRSGAAWGRFHWRALAVGALVASAVAVALIEVLPVPDPRAERVQRLLAANLRGEALAVCESVKDRPTRVACIAVEQTNGQACPAASRVGNGLDWVAVAIASNEEEPARCGEGDTTPKRGLSFIGAQSDKQKCALFAQLDETVPEPQGEKKESIEERRRWRRALRGRLAEIGGGLPRGLIPERWFTACE